MRTLQDDALLTETSNIQSLKELLAFCADNPRIGNSCDKSGYFWRESLIRLFGKTLVLQRGDLGIEDWPIFVKILATGRNFQYVVSYNSANNIWLNPEPYNLVENVNLLDNDMFHFEFTIPVAVPVTGTKGYFVRVSFDGSQTKEMTTFFVGPDNEQSLKLASEWVAIIYLNYHRDTLGLREMDFATEVHYHEDQGQRGPLPSIKLLLDLVNNKALDVNGNRTDTWYGYYQAEQWDMNSERRYSDTNYEIVPIVF